jgi:phosphatidate phosphatase APP1
MQNLSWTKTQGHVVPNKQELMDGITQWVRQRTAIANATITYLSSLTIRDLTLLAMSLGHQPAPIVEENLRLHFNYEAKKTLERDARWRQRQTERDIREGRPIFLPDQSEG